MLGRLPISDLAVRLYVYFWEYSNPEDKYARKTISDVALDLNEDKDRIIKMLEELSEFVGLSISEDKEKVCIRGLKKSAWDYKSRSDIKNGK